MSGTRHLAQYNLARFKGDKNGAHMADFYANLDFVNTLGDRMPGCVWRFKSAEGENAPVVIAPGAENVAANLTVWEDIESLESFVWQTVHAKFYRRKGEWFEKMNTPHLVLWWIDAGHRPTLAEAEERLQHLITNGPSEYAFGWESAPAAKLWREQRCA